MRRSDSPRQTETRKLSATLPLFAAIIQPFPAVAGDVHRVAGFGQPLADEIRYPVFVFDDQDPHRVAPHHILIIRV